MDETSSARVIVGIDGSEQALVAVRAAAREAYHRNKPLHIIHACIWPSLHVDVGPVAGDLPETGLRHHAEDLLEEAATEARKAAPQVPRHPIEPDPGIRMNSTSQPLDNVDQFISRPVDAVSGLVPSRQLMDEVLDALRAAGADVSDVVVLHGPEGVRILDTDGTKHGGRARFVRFFQNWGYDDAVLNLYDEGLRKGASAVMIPSTQENKVALARLLQQRRGHAIHYFGVRSAESLSGP